MDTSKNILIAVDDSEATHRTVDHVATIIDGQKEFHVHLFHVLSLPPKLLEFGGSEDPKTEQRKQAELNEAQARWIKESTQAVFDNAKAILRAKGVPTQAVETHFVTSTDGSDVVTSILEAARANNCGTIAVGRESFSWLEELVQQHVGDELMRQKGKDLNVWIVE